MLDTVPWDKPTLSLCMITCDEEKTLRRCLESVAGLYDELIIVDTGSNDKTIEIALEFNAKFFQIPWRDDFSIVRNYGLAHASKDWIFILDADEVVSKIDVKKIRQVILNPDFDAYQFITRNYTNNPFMVKALINSGQYSEGAGYRSYAESVKTRLFRNFKGIQFRYVIHELVDPDVLEKGLRGAKVDIPIHHLSEDPMTQKKTKKAYFYLRLSEKKLEENPDSGQAWWELGISQYVFGQVREAARSLKHAITLQTPTAEQLFTIASITSALGDNELSAFFMEKGVCKSFPNLTHISTELKKDPW